ncbi:hypothetical protein [Mesorhizobium sp. INR15]|uniref:RraA family protein n=1 Tax=Mesorhizobium sp. INR15 TaxID=2654248 RepID=UPI0018964CE0|nr:hypothetical protein [Mesorhizobium sp. INR15]QPC95526.1 hypothetical protein GA829_33595 [Mesorhizobium sp. INR15]
MDSELLDLLRSVGTPTVCNAIEVVQGKRGFGDFTRGTMLCSAPDEPAVVGYARTAKIAAMHPPTELRKARRMAYYRYMAEAPRPAVTMMEDVYFPDCVGAYWGEINANVHKGFGISGVLTNGVMRDLGDLPEGNAPFWSCA